MSYFAPPPADSFTGPERRRYARKNVLATEAVRAVTVDLGGELQALLIDVGEGGMQVQPYGSLQPGSTGELCFDIPGKGARFEGIAMVAWVNSGGRAGIQFLNVPEASRLLLREWLALPAPDGTPPAPPVLEEPAPDCDSGEAPAMQGEKSAALGAEAALHLIAERAAEITGATGAAIATGDNQRMQCRASVGNAPDVGVWLSGDSGLSGACLRTAEIVQCDDTENDPRVDPMACRQLNLRSALVVPVLVRGRLAGILETFSAKPRGFQAADRERLTRLAGLIAAVLEGGGERDAKCETARAIERLQEPEQTEKPAAQPALANTAPPQAAFEEYCSPVAPVVLPGAEYAAHLPGPPPRRANVEYEEYSHPRRVSPIKSLIIILLLVALVPILGVDPRRQFRKALHPGPHTTNSAPAQPMAPAAIPAGVSFSDDRMNPASLGGDSPLTLGSRVEGCKLIHKVNPVYPLAAGVVPAEKTVVLGVTVTKEGAVENVHVLKGEPELAKAAVAAVRQWRYQPYLVDGRPSEVETTVTVQFSPPKK